MSHATVLMNINHFYNVFDRETVDQRTMRPEEYRSPFQVDRDRVIHSGAFRSLQSKTQVFLAGEYDFYRTRLTHSIEVAQIGRSICSWLHQTSPYLRADHYLDADLVEAVCLAHDLGHPPFGHRGEQALNRLMASYGGFEGNAQTLRILTETLYTTDGMAPTRGFLDGILKYKSLYRDLAEPDRHFLYSEQDTYLDFVFAGTRFPAKLKPGKDRNQFRSLECQIMDWADDAAYSLHDIADGIQAGFITVESLERWASEQADQDQLSDRIEHLLRTIRGRKTEKWAGWKIGEFITGCALMEANNHMSASTNRYRYDLGVRRELKVECKTYKRIATDLVFRSPQLQQLDAKADMILTRLFETLAETYLTKPKTPRFRLLSGDQEARLQACDSEVERARLLCDTVANLTDSAATRMYKRLFDADFGSILDLV